MASPDTSRDRSRFEPSLIERGLSHIAPKTAQRLYQSRVKFEASAALGRGIGGYIGARRDRSQTAEWSPGGGSPAVDIIPDLPMLRDRSRDQARNAPIAAGAIATDVLHVVGTGLSYNPSINAKILGISEEKAREWSENTKWRFGVWAASTDCDYYQLLDFYSLTELGYRTWDMSGDAWALTPVENRNGEDTLIIQILEADRVCNPRGTPMSDTMQEGVELDAAGRPVAIHVAKHHPGDLRGGNDWTRVELRGAKTGRRNVLPMMDVDRPGQVRGVPWLAPIIEPLKQIQKWSDNELNAAVVSSVHALFMEMEAEGFAELYDDGAASKLVTDAQRWSGKMESGKVVNLLPGEKAHMVSPGRPNPEFDPFWNAMVRQIGMTLGIPIEVLTMHFQSSYTAARGALVMAWRRFYYRREKMAKLFCQPVFELWLENEVAAGRIACPGFFANRYIHAAWCAATWTGDGPGSVDQVKDVQAAKLRVDMGISTLEAESIAFDGRDWETKNAQRAREVAIQKRDGTAPAAMPGSVPVTTDSTTNADGTDTETGPSNSKPIGRRK